MWILVEDEADEDLKMWVLVVYGGLGLLRGLDDRYRGRHNARGAKTAVGSADVNDSRAAETTKTVFRTRRQ